MDLSSVRSLWRPNGIWLNTAQYGIPPRPAHEAFRRTIDVWCGGRDAMAAWDGAAERVREHFAALVNADPADIAHGASTSQLLGPVALAVPDGGRVVVPDVEYTSNVYPWMVHTDRNVAVVTPGLRELADAIDDGTSLVAFSLVQSATGEVAPVERILAAAERHGALVSVDATQAVGWLPVEAERFDALVCSCYKWLMAPRGIAYAYFSPRLRARMRPTAACPSAAVEPASAYYSPDMRLTETARRFDISPSWLSVVSAEASLRVVRDIGVASIHDHNVGLANRFRAGLGHASSDSAIVALDIPEAAEKLDAAGIGVSERAGMLRASFHVYVTEADVDHAIAALR